MEKQTGKQLLTKLKDGNISPEELKFLESWYEDYISKEVPFDDAPSFLKDMEILDNAFPFEIEKQIGKSTTYKLLTRIIAIAAAIVLVVLGVYLFNYPNNEMLKQVQDDVVRNDLAPGKVGATLTLASGKKIRLADAVKGELANESGISITKTKDGQLVYEVKGSDVDPNKINTLSTAKGETYQVRLPDGSLVYLNAASSLTYSVSLLGHGKRTVRLSGEGFFEISKDKKHPFVVQTDKQEVEVLGTHFNINAYANEPVVKTTLLEGSIRVSNGSTAKLLIPGYEAVNSDTGIQLNKINVEIAVAWKNKQLMFESENIQTIMRMVERWYDVEVIYAGEATNETFSGGVSRYDNISELLKTLESTGKLRFKIEGRKVYVSNN